MWLKILPQHRLHFSYIFTESIHYAIVYNIGINRNLVSLMCYISIVQKVYHVKMHFLHLTQCPTASRTWQTTMNSHRSSKNFNWRIEVRLNMLPLLAFAQEGIVMLNSILVPSQHYSCYRILVDGTHPLSQPKLIHHQWDHGKTHTNTEILLSAEVNIILFKPLCFTDQLWSF